MVELHNPGGVDVPALLTRLAQFFATRQDGDVWLVGGAVRDAILGRGVHDVDLATPGLAEPVGRALAEHLGGTVVPILAHNVARVALPAADDGRPPFLIDIAGYFHTFEEDLYRRDFTINSMGLPLSSWGPRLAHGRPGGPVRRSC